MKQHKHWYALRATYGRERKAYDYVIANGVKAFYPTQVLKKTDKEGLSILVEESLLPNIFFIYATENVVKSFVFDNLNLPFLRFYYNLHHDGSKEPLIVPEKQLENLRILCDAKSQDSRKVPDSVSNFKKGQFVRVISGPFKGIEGVVSRWHGQQRVGIIVDGLGTFSTSYIPAAFLETIV